MPMSATHVIALHIQALSSYCKGNHYCPKECKRKSSKLDKLECVAATGNNITN